jgi:hypothetical protein
MEDVQSWMRKNPMWTAVGAVVVGTVLYRAFKKPDMRSLVTRGLPGDPGIHGGAFGPGYITGAPSWRSTMFPV